MATQKVKALKERTQSKKKYERVEGEQDRMKHFT